MIRRGAVHRTRHRPCHPPLALTISYRLTYVTIAVERERPVATCIFNVYGGDQGLLMALEDADEKRHRESRLSSQVTQPVEAEAALTCKI